jgi:hypothetical protein
MIVIDAATFVSPTVTVDGNVAGGANAVFAAAGTAEAKKPRHTSNAARATIRGRGFSIIAILRAYGVFGRGPPVTAWFSVPDGAPVTPHPRQPGMPDELRSVEVTATLTTDVPQAQAIAAHLDALA